MAVVYVLSSPYGHIKVGKIFIPNGRRSREIVRDGRAWLVRFSWHKRLVRVPAHWIAREDGKPTGVVEPLLGGSK